MVWGGSLNKKGTDRVRELKKADEAIKFLEKLKENLDSKDKEIMDKTIDIILNFFTK
ncbi:MAG: hypothetical protein ACTSRH_06690 [Promethearchaeota archaeon]